VQRVVSTFDLVHIHEIWHHPHFAAYCAAKRAGKPYIVSIRGALESWCLNYKALKKRVYATLIQKRTLREASVLHALTVDELRSIRAFGLDNHVVVIPNGLDATEFQDLPGREKLEQLYPQLRGKQVVLFLGRIHSQKGLDLLAEAFGRIVEERREVCLLIAGPDHDGYRAQVERVLSAQGALDKVIFPGMLSGQEKLAALSGVDLFVLPSYSEGFSMAILDALFCGLPVIITGQCHFPEVAQAKAGVVIEPDVDQLVEALVGLLDRPELRKEMGENGRQLIMEKFTWEKVADQMFRLYEDVLRKM